MRTSISSTISKNINESIAVAKKLNMGIELSRVPNLQGIDTELDNIAAMVKKAFDGFESHRSLHGMFFDLSVSSNDPLIKEVSQKRYRQSLEVGKAMNAEIIVFHSGNKGMKHKQSQEVFRDKSIQFWKEFIKEFEDAGIIAVIENVHECYPAMILDIIKNVGSQNLRASLDTGHANLFSNVQIVDWIDQYKPYLSHMHIHNNMGDDDAHSNLYNGSLDFTKILNKIKSENIDPLIVFEMFNIENIEKSLILFNQIFEDELCKKN